MKIHNEASVDKIQLEDLIYNENLIQHDDDTNNDDSKEQINKLVLNTDKKFDTWNLADKFLDDYTKQEGFSIYNKRHTLDPKDNTIIRHQTYECSYASTRKPQRKF
ncbi:12976_t:CDS:1 [Cetraspora pellucida]|uniref:12976_t:CDS:1 n=1 Tax=Cetraspora pellucida TaxID=1433469 RepID=A0ACA9KL30_9GLOM|nr:12976_t:CDS:1 [Cetraspora pellucida]